MTPGRANLDVLRGVLRSYEGDGGLVVAYSGGADSAFLAVVAHQALRDRMVAVTAVSPSLAASERADAAAFAAERGIPHLEVETDELERAAYQANDGDRCFWCKDALMDALVPLADGRRIALGVNLDDLGDHRPGQQAAAGRGAVFPLVEAGFTKSDVRAASRKLGLRTWDKPAAPCLASRVPYGTAVSVELLGKVERAEAGLRALGFRELRVRHGGDVARVEVPVDDLARVVALRADVVAAVQGAGYRRVTLDLEGLRSGNLNADLPA